MLSLLLLAVFAALLYVGPVYPATVQQLHLYLRLPQASQDLEVNFGAGRLLAADSVQSAVAAAVSKASTNTLSFEVCGALAHQRVDIVSGELTARRRLSVSRPVPSRGPQGPHGPLMALSVAHVATSLLLQCRLDPCG